MKSAEPENHNGSGFITIRNISRSYCEEGLPERKVLSDVNALISKGEIIVLLGRSGSGKSTLLNLLSGIDLPDSGEIIYAGTNITSMNEKERTLFRRNNIGFIFQFFNLIPTLTVMENLLLPFELKGKISSNEVLKCRELLADVGLEGREKSYPDRLSGGEQQRVAIARAIVHEPSVILADEPTGNLDFETGIVIVNLLDKLIRGKNLTMIMATHSREVIGMADRILSLKEGGLIELPKDMVFTGK